MESDVPGTMAILDLFFMLLVVFWSGRFVYTQEGIGLTLNNVQYTNNSVVNITDIGTDGAALFCTTTRPGCCLSSDKSNWYFPNRNAVQRSETQPYYRTRTFSNTGGGTVRLHRNSGATTTGVFNCTILDGSGNLHSIYVGIYTTTTGTPSVTNLAYNRQSRTLTCTSTGGPATNVTWRRDGVVITLNGTYQQTQIVTNTTTSTYQTVLTIDSSVNQSDIAGTYNCTVNNIRGESSMVVVVSSNVMVSVTAGGNPTLGQSYTLTCDVSVTSGVTGTPTVQWVGPGSSAPIAAGGDFTVSSTSPYTLTINPLRQSHAGQYTCRATVNGDTGTASVIVDIPAPMVSTSITSPTGPFTVGQSYTLTCTANVAGVGTMSTTTITWTHPSGSVTSGTGSSLDLTLNPLRVSDAGQYTCNVSVSSPFLTRPQSATDTVNISVQVSALSVDVGFATPGAVTYAGNNVALNCGINLLEGVTDSDVTVSSSWTKDGVPFSGLSGRVTLTSTTRLTPTTYFTQLMFSPLSSSMDNATYVCSVILTPQQPQFVTGTTRTDSMDLAVIVPILTVTLTPNTTRLPNVAPYNTFSLTCTATSSVEGVGNVALPKRFTWRSRYGPDTTGLTQLSSDATIQIQDGDNLTQPTSSSMLTVTEDISQDYRYRCRVDLDLPADNIFTLTDVYPITVTGPSTPLQPSNLMSTDITHNRATIHWTVSMIAYTPENYTVGTNSSSLTNVNQQRQSGDNFTATNLQFSLQLTGLSAGTTYYYQVVAVNTVGSNQSIVRHFTTNELPPTPPQMFRITSVMATNLSFSWQTPVTLNGVLSGYLLTCQPLLSGIPLPQTLNTAAVMDTLSGLYPGVGYNCSIVARNSAGPSVPVYISDTTLETAPTGPPQSFTVTPGRRNMTFSWSPPAPTLRNGVISGYFLSCVPETGGGNTISMQYTAAGTFTLGGFTPATSYNCCISARNSQGSGPATYQINTTLEAPPSAPPRNIMVALIDDFPEMLFFSWLPPPLDQQNGMITEYTIVCTPSGGGQSVDYMNDISLNATVMMFTPATQYNCAFTASTSAGPGVETVLPVLTLPSSPENVTLVTLTTGSSRLRVTWTIDPPDGLISNYTIYVTRLERGNTVVNYTYTNTRLLQFHIPNLDPYELVVVNVSASNSAGEGPRSFAVNGTTREEPPGIVSNCPSMWDDQNGVIQVTWAAPQEPNGVLLRYYIQLTRYDDGRTVIASASTNATLSVELIASNLEDGVPYNVSIFAETSAGNGTKCNVTDFTNELSPPAPSDVDSTRINGTTVRVSWRPLSLVEAQGHITYRVMVAPITGSRRRRQATQEERVCTVGRECEVPANESSVIVVGLDRDTSYSVTVRAVNSEGEAGPTSMSTIPPGPTTPASQTPIAAIAGAVAGVLIGLIIVTIVIIIIVCCLKRRKAKYMMPDNRLKEPLEEMPTLVHSTSKGFMQSEEDLTDFQPPAHVQTSGATEHQVMDRLKPVTLSGFSAHVHDMHQDRDKGFEHEYQSISNDPQATFDVAKLSYNKTKNRFANIYPYDFSRVKLQEIEGVEGSDYVNASYIDGYSHPNAYIAAQGPLPNTVIDFWRMIWEHKLVTTVMLTKCTEAGKRKCEQYWPDNVNDTYTAGNLSITLTDLVPYADYEIKRFSIKDTSKPDTPTLNVTHYHFLGWPDHGVPKFATSLIAFIRRVRKSHKKDGPPMLVHCSAGVGRTGTFILLDSMLERMKAEDTVNVYQFLRNMRAKRPFMVQTLMQYVFIHDALEELITCGETDISAGNLRVKVNRLHKIVPGKAISGFEDQFKLLDSVSRKPSAAECSDALQHYNKHKNRYDDRVPYNLSRTRLRPTGVTGAEYINASFVDGYKLRNAYIAAQSPLQETVSDFWRMIWEFKSKAIVMLCNFEESGQEACYPFWPTRQGESETYGKLLVTLQEEEPGKEYTVRKFEIKDEKPQTPNQNQTLSFIVTMFHYTEWPEHDRPYSTTTVLKLIEEVNKVQRSTGNRPITVMCNDGMGRTGTFFCIHAQLERVKSEGLVDFFQFVKSSRIHRPSIISDLEQYIFCHESLADYLDSFDTYANFKELC